MDKIDVNQIVRVKLTKYGVDVFKEYYGQFSRQVTQMMDKDGYTTFKLWELMQLYGPHMETANPRGVPFNTEIFIGRELQEPCEYCNPAFINLFIDDDGLYLFIDKDRLFAGYSDECTFEKSESVKINYCPACGRKMEVEDE